MGVHLLDHRGAASTEQQWQGGERAGGGGTGWMGFRSKIFESHESHGNIFGM